MKKEQNKNKFDKRTKGEYSPNLLIYSLVI